MEKATVRSNEPPLTDAVRKLLDSVKPTKSAVEPREATTKVPLSTLQALAEKVRRPPEYERVVANL